MKSWDVLHPQQDQAQDRHRIITGKHHSPTVVLRQALAKEIAAVPDALVDSLFFAGPAEACAERLEAQAEAGIDLHTVNVALDDPHEAARSLAKLVG